MPEIEEREAAIRNGYTWKEWQEFDLLDLEGRYQRAAGIAFIRVQDLKEHHVNDAMSEDLNRRNKAAQHG